ncbi:TonB-dependent receptor [Edaphosphingomonas haloaromaticamans]|uniref:Pesticin receptor n=1 Tax=Edaphosphingomonas haloaromaticamans TaxID=653954 RepID=A0A1S1HG66_9SPHN|nr:TonB-dependent receptor [Sphingomonas haloaromaticamans]OHT20456.1 Pesticin receptor precursor [Sphingomonas haloaromaticamans]
MTRFNRGASLLALAMAFGIVPALAQETAADAPAGNGGLEDIVVTAQKRSENVQQVPIAISAVNSEYLQSRDISSIDQLGSVAPNMKIDRAPSNKTISQIAIRGSVTINPAITWEPAVGMYVDGVYIAKAQGSIFDIADLERIEVLRGPQGTLYGRNTLAGAVNLVTKKPSGELGGSAELTYGNFDAWKLKGVLDLPQMGIFSAKVSGQIQKRDGVIKVEDNAFGITDTNDLDNQSFMVQLRAQPTDNLTLDYAYDYSNFNQRPDYAQLYKVNQNGQPGDIFDPNSVGYSGIPLGMFANKDRQKTAHIDADVYEKTRTQGHALTASLDLGDATIKSITAYRKLRFHDNLDLDGSPLDIANTARNVKYHQFSQELQVSGKALDDRIDYVAGLFYFKDHSETDNPQAFFFHSTNYDSTYGSHTEAYAAYAQVDFHATDKLVLTGGLRYNHETKDISRYLAFNGMPLIDVAYGDVPKAKYNNLSPAATVRYEITDRVNVYARYARGYKSGGFNGETNEVVMPTTDCPSGAPELCNPYKPEKVDSYEIGFKSRMLDNKLQLNVAGFWDEHKDIQLAVFSGSGAAASVVRNAGAARIRGIEIEAIARPADFLTFNTSFSILDAKYKSFIEDDANGVPQQVADNRAFPHTPKYTASIGADWRVVEGDWGKFNLIGDLNYVSKYYTYPYAIDVTGPSDQTAMTTQSQGRTIVNLRGVVSDVPLGGVEAQFSFWVRNLFKENNPQNFIDFGPSFGGMTVAYFPDPRTYGITAGIRF